jgi:hypothetical protein
MSRLRCEALLCWLLLGLEVIPAQAAVELVPDGQPTAVFGQGKRSIRVLFRNAGDRAVETNLRWRLYQASSSTLAPMGETQPWRMVPLGAGQTVIETLEIDLPQVRSESAFQVVWFDRETKLGATPLRVFPDSLLQRLTALAGDAPVGLVDPEGQFKPVLAGLRVEELKEAEDISATEARLILIAPMNLTNRPAGLHATVKKKARGGVAFVWVQAPTHRRPEPLPSTYLLEEGSGRVIVTSSTTVSSLAESPRAQLNLLRMAELAIGKAKLEWPTDSEPLLSSTSNPPIQQP